MTKKKFVVGLLQLYLILAPINWVPFLPAQAVNISKYILFTLLIFSTFFPNGFRIKPYKFFSVTYFFFVLVCTVPAIIMSYDNPLLDILGILLIFCMNWVINNSLLSREELFRIFYRVTLVIGFICLLSILSAITGITIKSPEPWNDSFSQGALGGYRTGWSNSIFLFVPFVMFYYSANRNKKVKILCVLILVSIVGSQILSGGRSGLIGSLLVFLFFTRFNIKGIITLVIIAFITVKLVTIETIEEHFRASDEQIENKKGESNLDKISSERIIGYKIGMALFIKSPLVGYGFGASDYLTDLEGYSPDIHNTILKRLVDGGILLVMPLIILFIFVYKKVIKNIKVHHLSSNYFLFFRSLFFVAILISMGEPNYLVGSFQGEGFFWALTSTFLLNERSY